MNRREAERVLGIGPKTFLTRVREGKIRYLKVDGEYMYFDDDVYRLANKVITKDHWIIVYTRVGIDSKEARIEHHSQEERLTKYAVSHGLKIDRFYHDTCPSMDFSIRNRTGLYQLMIDIIHRKVGIILVEREDRLCIYGSGVIRMLCEMHGVKLIIVNDHTSYKWYDDEVDADLLFYIQKLREERQAREERESGIELEIEEVPLIRELEDSREEETEESEDPDLSDLI